MLLTEGNRAYITTQHLSPTEVHGVQEALQRDIAPCAQETAVNPQTRQTETRDVISESQVSAAISTELTRNAFSTGYARISTTRRTVRALRP